MADVGRDRAQLVLVAALVLATILIGLALVVNTVIFTENLATRQSVDTGDTVKYRHAARGGTAGALYAANFASDTADYPTRSGNFTSSVSGWSTSTTRYGARTGQSVRIEVLNWSKGTRISQETPANFRPADWNAYVDAGATDLLELNAEVNSGSPHEDWPVANDTRLRDFEMTVEESSLETTNQTLIEEILELDLDQSAFWIQVDNGTDTYRVAAYDDNESGRVGNMSVIVYDGAAHSQSADCTAPSRSDGTVDIDLTGGTITGADGAVECEPLSFFRDIGEYNVYYVNGDEVRGTYSFISDKPDSTYSSDYDDFIDSLLSLLGLGVDLDFDDSYYDSATTGEPFYTTAIYDTHVQMTYQTDELTYRTQIRLAPGEPGEDDS